MSYKVTTTNNKQGISLWDAEAEAIAVLFAKAVQKCRGLTDAEARKLILELNYTFLRKRTDKTVKKTSYGPTKMQRAIFNNDGY